MSATLNGNIWQVVNTRLDLAVYVLWSIQFYIHVENLVVIMLQHNMWEKLFKEIQKLWEEYLILSVEKSVQIIVEVT